MTLTASQCDNSAAPSTPDPKLRPRTVAQMDQVKPSQIGIQSKLPDQWSCKSFTPGQLS